jgi:hypothetical protein
MFLQGEKVLFELTNTACKLKLWKIDTCQKDKKKYIELQGSTPNEQKLFAVLIEEIQKIIPHYFPGSPVFISLSNKVQNQNTISPRNTILSAIIFFFFF